jgi:hypothetical protein
MANQIITKPLGFIRDLKIFVHDIPYTITFIVIDNIVINFNYSMLVGCPWLKDAKVSHDWGTNTNIISGTTMIKTIPIARKLGAQTKRPKALVCYDFDSKILDEKEDIMFATKLVLFSIGTIKVYTHTKLVSKPIHPPNLSITDLIPKLLVELVCVLIINLIIPLDSIKQHLADFFFH